MSKRRVTSHDGAITLEADAKLSEWQIWLLAFGREPHGERKLTYWRTFVHVVWPDPVFIWDDWSDLFFGALCGAEKTIERITGKTHAFRPGWWRNVIATGASSTGKSARAALWILGNWLCAQEHTACILTSTSVDMLSKRIWADILTWLSNTAIKFPLRSIPSDLELRWSDDDRKHAVFGVAVKSGGNPQEAVDRIKGVHCPRIFVVVDEMTSVAQAIVTACRNLNKGTKEYQLLGLGNAISKTDPHGERSEPEAGWNSIAVEDKFWITRYGCAVHFDAFESPAMSDPVRFHFYPNRQAIEEEAREKGGMNSPEAWSGIRGFWPPTGLSNTVMDEALLDQFNVRDPAIWDTGWTMGAAADPAFEGGDRRVLYPFRFGKFANGITGLEFFAPVIVEVDMSQDKRWIHYQVSDGYQRACEQYKVNGQPHPILPENFIMDTTGEGGGLFSVLSGRWSSRILSVEFGGAADKSQISPDRPTTWYELYGNKVTMLWYAFRRFVEGSQIRGLTDAETIKELCAREKLMRTGKTVVVPKSEMKKFTRKSPDKADAACIAAEFMRRKGIAPAGNTGGGPQIDFDAWNEMVAARSRVDSRAYEDANAAYT